jgi:predicted enzyme related to lactoylglutathione lyase
MPEVSSHPPGWPSWIDLHSPNIQASKDFYTGLFGWDSYTMTLDQFGDCEMFTQGGVQGPEVAGMHALADDSEPPSWTCYFRSDDLQRTVDTVTAAGGKELIPPTDYANLGRMAVCRDQEGADFGLWTPFNLAGAGVVDEPSTVCWVELACRDREQARHFYGQVFGWQPVSMELAGSDYTSFDLGEAPVAGMLRMDERWPPHYPAHWIPYFQVVDCDDAVARAIERGAWVRVGPTDAPTGRFAIMSDPTGARMAVIEVRGRWLDARRRGR